MNLLSSRDLSVIIFAGGRSESLERLSGGVPKTFIEILGRPIIDHTIRSLREAISSRIKKLIVVTDKREYAELIATKYSDMNIVIAEQRKLGVANAYKTAFEHVDSNDKLLLLIYGDIVVDKSLYASIVLAGEEELSKEDFGGVFLGVPEEPRRNHWLMDIDERGLVREILPSTVKGYGYIAGGVYLVKSLFSKYVKEYDDTALIFRDYVRDFKVKVLYWGHYWVDIGSPWDLLEASYRVLSNIRESVISKYSKISPHTIIEGPVVIDEDAEIDHNVIIKGPVYIGRKSFIGANSFIRNYSSIEREAFISSYTEINRSMILPEASIGRGSYIGYSVIGFKSVVEPGVITKNIIRQRREEAMLVVSRGREYGKLGSVVYARSRVYANSILEPGEEVEEE
ncbi:MAG: sugar phosphate nucleotidyltransferase [Sulfolobales archaeon]